LVGAAEAQRLFKEAIKDQVFDDKILVLEAIYCIDLGMMASNTLRNYGSCSRMNRPQ
jgi:hypothetical protein